MDNGEQLTVLGFKAPPDDIRQTAYEGVQILHELICKHPECTTEDIRLFSLVIPRLRELSK